MMDVHTVPNRSIEGEETHSAGWRRTFVPQQAAPEESSFFKLIARSVQFSSASQSCPTLTTWIVARQASLSIINSRSLLKLMPIESVMPSSHLILCRPFLLLPIPPSIRVFSNESTLRMRWPKYWSFSFSISPSNEHARSGEVINYFATRVTYTCWFGWTLYYEQILLSF